MALLQLEQVTQRFGGLVAVNELTFAVDAGSIVAMIGPNGAGKSTVFNLVTGIYKPSAGRVVFDGADVTGAATSKIKLGTGICLVPERDRKGAGDEPLLQAVLAAFPDRVARLYLAMRGDWKLLPLNGISTTRLR